MNLYLKGLNYCYVVYKDDNYQFIEHIADTKKDLAKCLNTTDSNLSHLMHRKKYRFKFKIEKVQISDFCFVVYKKGLMDLDNIVFASRSFDYIARKYKINKPCETEMLKFFFHPYSYKLRIDWTKQCFKINDKFSIGLLDMFELDSHQTQAITNIMMYGKNDEFNY